MFRSKYLLFFLLVFCSLKSEANIEYYRFTFEENSSKLTDDHKEQLDKIAEFIYLNPSVQVYIKPYQSDQVSDSLSEERYKVVVRYLINLGVEPLHFEMEYQDYDSKIRSYLKARPDSPVPFGPNDFEFVVSNTQISPCDSVNEWNIIHFKPNANEIFHTECGNLEGLYDMIKKDESTNYVVIGIAKDKSTEEKEKALKRAQVVIDALKGVGIDTSRLKPSYAVYKKPDENGPFDWPYYPKWYNFEIGAYLEIDY